MSDSSPSGRHGGYDRDVRRRLVERAVERWRSQLVDLTGRNKLIYYSQLPSGTLNLDRASSGRVSQLMAGGTVRLSELYPSERVEIEGEVGVDTSMFDEAGRRMRTIDRTGRANFEEKGINTTYLASHLVTWEAGSTSSAVPNAPVLLAPLETRALGGSQRDFELRLKGEWEVNQTLLIFWLEVFGATIDADDLGAVSDENQRDLDIIANAALKAARATGLLPNLELSSPTLIGNFSYTKMPMVKDLEASIDLLADNDLIAAIAGDRDATTIVRDRNAADDIAIDIPNRIPLEDEFLILDADSSQSHVINTVLAGKSTIVEGPPGTGKSQTISNLIASLSAHGKSVLFVAEKRAAIEAVLKRLEGVGLGDLALDLHSNVIRKKDLAQSLAQALERVATSGRPDVGRQHAELAALRSRLVDYDRELHEQREPWGKSSFDINAELLAYKGLPFVELEPAVVEQLSEERLVELEGALTAWILNRRNTDWSSPWTNAGISSTADSDRLTAVVREVRSKAIPRMHLVIETMEQECEGCGQLSAAELVELAQLSTAVDEIEDQVEDGIWQVDLPVVAAAFAAKRRIGGGGPEYRQARRAIKSVQRRRLGRRVATSVVDTAKVTAERWHEISGSGLPRQLRSASDAASAAGQLIALLSELKPGFGFLAAMPFNELSRFIDLLTVSEQVAVILGQGAEHRQRLVEAGFEPLIREVEQGEINEDAASRAFNHSVALAVKRKIDLRNPVLNSFDSTLHTADAKMYATVDRQHLSSAVPRIQRRVAEAVVSVRNQRVDENALIEREARKKTRHKTLRQLQEEAGHVLTALKPCWIMSPLMVAQSLPARPIFDYVIFDEASQIRPEEAMSAIVRGDHLVVAGDRRQLPPSAFFDSTTLDVDEYDEEEVDALTAGYQSILDVTSALLPSRMLTWHYRSRDERLIALSNDHIYKGGLTTFPGSEQSSPVSFHKVDYVPTDPTEIRSNPAEVEAVVELMIEHARSRPDESLGVIAFGQYHASAIEDHLRRWLEAFGDAAIDQYFDENQAERVFVKNIERVQGDERDAIILSVGYGKDVNGRVPHRFGPVNQDGGERRINVAASRARSRMTIVSSIGSADLDTGNLGKGPQLLEHLLRFAETGGSDTGAFTGSHPLNAFELAVMFELQALGLDPIAQYGASGFRIDFALPHPSADGRMLLAVEADGARYHSSATARDRDRLRQQILEDKGWRFHRVWSTAFFKDPKGEAANVKAAYERALRGEPDNPPTPMLAAALIEEDEGAPSRPYLPKGVPIDEHDHRRLVALVRWITSRGESLLTDMQIRERMKDELGYQRMGHRIEAVFDRAIRGAGGDRSE